MRTDLLVVLDFIRIGSRAIAEEFIPKVLESYFETLIHPFLQLTGLRLQNGSSVLGEIKAQFWTSWNSGRLLLLALSSGQRRATSAKWATGHPLNDDRMCEL